MPTLVACLWRPVEALQPGRVPTHFGPAPRLRRPKSQWNQEPLPTSQVEMRPQTANSGLAAGERRPALLRSGRAAGQAGAPRLPGGWPRAGGEDARLLVVLAPGPGRLRPRP